jgi:hypothetical protein
MRERPILFSAPMIRALQAGTKTQTRRVVRVQDFSMQRGRPMQYDDKRSEWRPLPCPHGQPGDQLWVRERFAPRDGITLINRQRSEIFYWADDEAKYWSDGPWKPSIHMPRWASRITLEITGVRVERLQDISDEDAQAEGTPCYVCGGSLVGLSEADCHCFHRKANASDYRCLWESINGAGSWDANPWVWVVEFKRVMPA